MVSRRWWALAGVAAVVAGSTVSAQRDSTGIKLAEVPDWLPPKERDPLARRRALLDVAIDSMNAAIGRFNRQCGMQNPPAGCYAEYGELTKGAHELDSLKVAFRDAVNRAVAANPRTDADVARESGIKAAAGKANAAAKAGAAALPDAPAPGEKDNKPAVEQAGSEVDASKRYEPVFPEGLRKDPDFRKLLAERERLRKEYAELDAKLTALRNKEAQGGGDRTAGQMEAADLRNRLTALNSRIGVVNVKMEDMRVKFARANRKTPDAKNR